ncbi:ubiquinol-cytochrome c reductase iron-sulfur subunit [Mycolicibacterium sp.]|uniref:QcrA and Rieske domain-containing protein n=1 Tax=Mycolicibacterium sp. TaxID=2320850 RepID=UPI003D0A1B58
MTDSKSGLTRHQFLISAGLTGVAFGASACAGYGQQPAGSAVNTAAAQPDSPSDAPAPAVVAATPIAATADVPVGSGVIVDDIVLTQPTAGDFRAFSAVCTHAGCTLAGVADGTINCPCHGSRFNLDGTVATGPAKRPLEGKAVAVNEGVITAG